MIAITNEAGMDLHLFENQNLVTEQAVAWLTDDELPAEISYPIDAPLDDHNKRFVGYGYRVDAALPRQSLPVTVQLEGVLYRKCVFAYKVQNGKLNGYLKIDSAEVYDKLRKLTLLEALPDVIRLGTGVVDAVNGVTPILANRMKEIASMPPGQFPLTFFPIRNEGFWEENLDSGALPGFSRQALVNVWQLLPIGGVGFRQDGGFLPGDRGYTVVPQFYLWWVLGRIMNLAGYKIESSWLASEEVQRLVIVNMTAMKQTLGPVLSDPIGLIQGHRITAGLHLPEMSVSDFLKAIKGRFGLVFGFNANTRTCYMERYVDVVRAGAAIDLTPFQTGSYDTDPPIATGFSIEEFIDESDTMYQDPKGTLIRPAPYVLGKGTQSISLKVGTCQMSLESSPLTPVTATAGRWTIPVCRQAGNTLDPAYRISERWLDESGKRKNGIGLKLLSYRGMTQDSKGNPYPLATNDVRDGRQQIVGSQALTLSGRYGSWRQFLRAYYFFRNNTQKVSVPLLLPVTTLSQLQLHRAVHLSLEDQIGRTYLIAKLQAESPGRDGKSLVRLEVLTLPSGIDQLADIDDPVVFVELISVQTTKVYETAIPNETKKRYTQKLKTYSVKCWADAAKTTPVVATVLINALMRQSGSYADAYGSLNYSREFVQHYPVSAQTATLATEVVIDNYILEGKNAIGAYYGQEYASLSLAPGDGYTIL